jgi:hypothetical protein
MELNNNNDDDNNNNNNNNRYGDNIIRRNLMQLKSVKI